MRGYNRSCISINFQRKNNSITRKCSCAETGIAIIPGRSRIEAFDTTLISSKTDTAYVLVYLGEGLVDIWYQNKILIAVDEMIFSSYQDPEIEWWVLVENMKKEQGWLKIRSAEKEKFMDGIYSA